MYHRVLLNTSNPHSGPLGRSATAKTAFAGGNSIFSQKWQQCGQTETLALSVCRHSCSLQQQNKAETSISQHYWLSNLFSEKENNFEREEIKLAATVPGVLCCCFCCCCFASFLVFGFVFFFNLSYRSEPHQLREVHEYGHNSIEDHWIG